MEWRLVLDHLPVCQTLAGITQQSDDGGSSLLERSLDHGDRRVLR